MPVLGALFVFMFYNWYPAKVFDGNVGAFLMGGALGSFLIVNKLEIFGVFVLLPNIITFVADFYVLGLKKIPDLPFPKPRKDGLIVPDKSMRYKSFKNMICTLIPLSEKQATTIILAITAIFCIVGIFVF